MRVAVADQHEERQAPGELAKTRHVVTAKQEARDRLEIPLVLVVRVPVEHLSEVFDVSSTPAGGAIESSDRIREVLGAAPCVLRQSVQPVTMDQPDLGYLYAGGRGQRHHRVFVRREVGEDRIGQLHDPVADLAVNRGGELVASAQHRELRCNPSQREAPELR